VLFQQSNKLKRKVITSRKYRPEPDGIFVSFPAERSGTSVS